MLTFYETTHVKESKLSSTTLNEKLVANVLHWEQEIRLSYDTSLLYLFKKVRKNLW